MDTSADEAIARALGAEYYAVGDPDYAAEAAYVDDSEDSDYGGGPKKKKRRAPGVGRGRGRGRPPASASGAALPPVPKQLLDPGAGGGDGGMGMGMGMGMGVMVMGGSDGEGDSDDEDDRTKSGRRRRKDVGKQRQAGRAWTPEEESLFLQAMELHGRDWKKGSELVGTRDHRAIASHAQKFFIKLCLAGKPLPAAVARTGLGYTLSGAMLDPYSAAARSYGFKPELLTRLTAEELQQALSGLDLDRLPMMYGGRLPDDQAPAPPPPRNSSMGAGLGDERGRKPGRGMGPKKRRKGAASSEGDDDMGGGDVVGSIPADPTAAHAVAVAAAVMAAASAAGSGAVQGILPASLVAAAAAAAQAQFNAAAAGNLGLAAAAPPAPTIAPSFGSFTALLSGTSDSTVPPPPTAPLTGSLAAALQGSGPLSTLSAALAPPPATLAAPMMALPPPPPPPAVPQQTEYARNRPRRELAGQRAQMGGTSESLQLVKPLEFTGLPGSGAPLAQPYTVDMSTWALLAMDFHAHLSTYEVIGLLGGTWNPDTRQLVVIEAYACRRAEGSVAATSVELDPESQVEVQQMMEAKGQKCVGWYHSHPVFEPSPSQKDMDNQRNYQALFRCEQTRLEPFLGFIVGPYDIAMPQPISIITTFMVQQFKGTMVPYSVRCQVHGYEVVPDAPLMSKLVAMLDTFRDDLGRVDFGELWRGYSYVMADGSVDSLPLTRLAKFRHSLSTYMREADPAAVRGVLDVLCGELQNRWGVNVAAALAAVDGGGAGAAAAAEALAAQHQQQQQAGQEGQGAQPGVAGGGGGVGMGMGMGESMLGLLLADGEGPAPPPAAPEAAAVLHAAGYAAQDVSGGSTGARDAAAVAALTAAPVAAGGMLQALLADDDDDDDDDNAGPSAMASDAAAAAVAAVAAAAASAESGPGSEPSLLAQMTEAVQVATCMGGVGFEVLVGSPGVGPGPVVGQARDGMYVQVVGLDEQGGAVYEQAGGPYELTEGTEGGEEEEEEEGEGEEQLLQEDEEEGEEAAG